ncbi:hypothetical protein MPUL_48050 [Mycolicibacterium pulveris]|uniref:Uncharacterized protein n=1 Tax=Mycolicibacterium pulveris TaxID=36813 RepID=A0A7I7UQK2_MYCPV|nr:hypothetical protein [Mycolicibacterium pulveris]BBY83647.1 hypothetical protein MPUL_48050 [Mycolicibacterium pulveris]
MVGGHGGAGQLDDVRLAARDIRWNSSEFDHAAAVLHNVHVRPTAPPVHLPELPSGLRLIGISFAPSVIRLSGVVSEWRMEVPPRRLEDIIGALKVVGRPLNLTSVGRLL